MFFSKLGQPGALSPLCVLWVAWWGKEPFQAPAGGRWGEWWGEPWGEPSGEGLGPGAARSAVQEGSVGFPSQETRDRILEGPLVALGTSCIFPNLMSPDVLSEDQ